MKRPPRKTPPTSLRSRTRSSLAGYATLLTDLKHRIRAAQIRAALSVNRELIQLYWDIGRAIVAKQRKEGWGAAVIDKLAADLQREFPELAGFSRGNIYRMRAFYMAYGESSGIVAQPARQLNTRKAGTIAQQGVRQIEKLASNGIVPQPVGQIDTSSCDSIVAQPARQLQTAPPEPMASLPWFHNVTLIESLHDSATPSIKQIERELSRPSAKARRKRNK